MDEMPCGYGTVRTTGVRIRHQVSRRACAEVLAALASSCGPAQRSQQLQNLTILTVKFRSILNAPPSLQVLSGPRENAPAESENTLQSSMGGWEHLEVLRRTGEGYRSVWEVCVWLPDRITFCWCSKQALAVLGLLRVWIVWYISVIPAWRKDIDNLLSNIKSASRFIYRYLWTILTWRLSFNFILMYYLLVLYRSQRGYFAVEVQSCTFILHFYIMDIFITFYTWLFLVCLSKQVIDQEDSKLILWSLKEVRGASPITWWWLKGYFR